MAPYNTDNSQVDIDETVSRLSSKKGVESVTVMTKEGQVIQTTATEEQAETQARLLSKLATDAAEIAAQLDDQDELSFVRIRTKRHEVMVALDHDYLLVVVQSPQRD
ncbi:hypothetical protein GGI07_000258 [Coemansia sp. Benny D115]|nr:hypothetical protein GGI07_000258 [Coemansia sp. Benny D115]